MDPGRQGRPSRLQWAVALVLTGATLLTGFATEGAKASPSKTLVVVGYSTPGLVYGSQSTKGTLEYAFVHTAAGRGVTFTNSFGASDSQSQLVASGLRADVVNFSYEPNVSSLVA